MEPVQRCLPRFADATLTEPPLEPLPDSASLTTPLPPGKRGRPRAGRIAPSLARIWPYLSAGRTNRFIAAQTGVSVRAIESRKRQLVHRFKLANTTELTAFAARNPDLDAALDLLAS